MILTPDDVDARAHRRSARLNTLASFTSLFLSGAALLVALRQGGSSNAQPAAAAPAALAREAPAPREELTLHVEAEERDRLEHLGLVAGEVRAGACEVSSGSDFTAETVWGGAHGDVCTLRFEPPLETVPVVVVSATSYGKCYSRDVTSSEATIKCQTDLLSSAPNDAFLGFTFVAIAHKPPEEESR